VLNAFRHQRTERRVSHCQRYRASSVLNAFRHQRTERWCSHGSVTRESCAQRLSASTDGTQSRARFASSRLPVLNAFRHQRTERAVSPIAPLVRWMCSTPFGINGRNATPRPNR